MTSLGGLSLELLFLNDDIFWQEMLLSHMFLYVAYKCFRCLRSRTVSGLDRLRHRGSTLYAARPSEAPKV